MQPPYFIGIALPNSETNSIKRIQDKYYDATVMRKPLEPHITLVHPPSLKTIPYQHFVPKVKHASTPCLPITITFGAVKKLHKSTIYIEVIADELSILHIKLIDLLPKEIQAQYYVGRSFLPHITVLQTEGPNTINDTLLDVISNELQQFSGTTFTTHSLTLFRQKATRQYEQRTL